MTIPYTALLALTTCPVRSPAMDPSPATVARDLAAGGTWRHILTDPDSGRPLDYGITRYRPPAHLAGLVITRDQTCQFPGCRVSRTAATSTTPSPTTRQTTPARPANSVSAPDAGATIRSTDPRLVSHPTPDGCTTWTTPTGHVYHSQPHH